MKRFFNLSTCVMLAVMVISIIITLLSPTINWLGFIWMVIAAIWVVCARSNRLTAEDWKQLYDWQSRENARLLERVDGLRKQNNDYAEKYQTTAQDLDNANRKVEELTQALEAKKTQNKTTKKSKKSIAEIKTDVKDIKGSLQK